MSVKKVTRTDTNDLSDLAHLGRVLVLTWRSIVMNRMCDA